MSASFACRAGPRTFIAPERIIAAPTKRITASAAPRPFQNRALNAWRAGSPYPSTRRPSSNPAAQVTRRISARLKSSLMINAGPDSSSRSIPARATSAQTAGSRTRGSTHIASANMTNRQPWRSPSEPKKAERYINGVLLALDCQFKIAAEKGSQAFCFLRNVRTRPAGQPGEGFDRDGHLTALMLVLPDTGHITVHQQYWRDPALRTVDLTVVLRIRQRSDLPRGTDHPLIEGGKQSHEIDGLGRGELRNILSQHPELIALNRDCRYPVLESGHSALRVALVDSPPAWAKVGGARRAIGAEVAGCHQIECLVL